MICKQCNNNVPNDSEYCPFCGNIVEKVIVETNAVSDIEKGYTYLELKEWKKAKELFDFAIVNNDNKAKAYIGRLLAKLKLSDLTSLSSVNKKLTKFDDFKMAVKYAEDNYKQQLKKYYSLVEEKINQKKAKTKKRIIISSISSVSIVVLLALTYFVFIPLGRFSYYQNLLSNGKIEKATKSYSDSKWFEFSEKAEELFYNKAIKLLENKEYGKAIKCLKECDDYKDSTILYNYYNGLKFYNNQDFEKAIPFFEKSKDYKDGEVKYLYSKAYFEFKEKSYSSSLEAFNSLIKKGEDIENLKEYNFCKGIESESISDVKHYLSLCGEYDLAKKALKNLSVVEKIQGSWKAISDKTIGTLYKNMTITDMGGVCSVSRSISKIDYEDGTVWLDIGYEGVHLWVSCHSTLMLGGEVELINKNKIIVSNISGNEKITFVRTS
ncbi:MAG: hypothetical protein E7560_02810 [Ruminococcaceae bacterium]|nr:hypothetical protein [Oscillospiraceae bacterium]